MPRKIESWDEANSAVLFPAEDASTSTTVECAVEAGTLVAHFGGNAGDADSLLAAFRRYRPAIERAASDKYDADGRPARLMLGARDIAGATRD